MLKIEFSCLNNLQSHTVSELKIKFGDNDSVGRIKQLVHVYFNTLVVCSNNM